MKEIAEVFEFVRNGASIKQEEGKSGIPITRIETIWNKTIDQNRLGYADLDKSDLSKYDKYLLQHGDILMTHINSPKHLGKCAMYEGKPEKLVHGMNLLCLRPNVSKAIPTYLKYFFNSEFFKIQLPKIANQSVNQASFSAGNLKKLKIPLPPLPTQKKIASILDAADAYREKTKALIEKYDELTQSLFLDMFGDPVVNEKGWEKKELKEITIKIGSGSTPSGGKKAYKDEGISLIRSLNVHDNYFKFKNLAFIDEEQAHKLKNVIVKSKDVLFNITGASVCRCCIIPDEILPARVNQHVSILRPNSKLLNSIFLMYCLISKNTKLNLLGIGGKGGATREAITKSDLESFGIIIPSKSLQNQFAERVQKIEAQKAQAQESLEKAEELFNSLLGRAFKGELSI